MPYTVYKVVREHNGKLVSLYMTGPARFEYRLGIEVKSDTPIFVYADLREAHKAAQNNVTFRLLRGTTTTQPIQLIQQTWDILDTIYPYSPAMVQEFWGKVAKDKWDVKGNYVTLPVNHDAYGVYDFTPLENITP